MIIARINGGLGNQMFQYAAGRALALRLGAELKLDLSWFENMEGCTPRNYALDVFKLTVAFAEPCDLACFAKSASNFLNYFKKADKPWGRVVKEPYHRYWPGFEFLKGDICLSGFWQSERYFRDIREILINDFSFRDELQGENLEIVKHMRLVDSVSVHIRRGDYVQRPEARRFHGTCDIDYYARAMQYLATRVTAPHFYVFSDDQAWAQENIVTSHPVTFVSHNDAATSYEDLRLMSHCAHHIIANSSFSWWGAWLNCAPDKIVVAPQRWFAEDKMQRQTGDLLPTGWVRL